MKPVVSRLEEITLKAVEEIELKTWGITQKFMEIHQIIYVNDKPKIAKVDRDKNDGTAIVYFPVEGERFYFTICINIDPEVAVVGIHVEPYISVCFSASSETIDLDMLANMTTLKATSTWKKGLDYLKITKTKLYKIFIDFWILRKLLKGGVYSSSAGGMSGGLCTVIFIVVVSLLIF